MTLTPLVIAKLALVPAVVWLASLAARRWGHAVSGYLGGFPMIGGPITLYLAIDFGPAFAAQVATATLAAVAGQAGHLLGFAYAGRARGPVAGLACGLGAYIAIAVVVDARVRRRSVRGGETEGREKEDTGQRRDRTTGEKSVRCHDGSSDRDDGPGPAAGRRRGADLRKVPSSRGRTRRAKPELHEIPTEGMAGKSGR